MLWKYVIRDRLIINEESGTCRAEVDFGNSLYMFIF